MKKYYNESCDKLDLKQLSEQEVEGLSAEMGSKVRELVDHACAEANKILNSYGLRTKMQIVIEKDEPQRSK